MIQKGVRRALFLPLISTLAAQPPTFHISTRLIQINVIVHDKQGGPVTGLDKDQFSIFDQGHAQKIVLFAEQSHRLPAPQTALASTPPGAHVFSNRPDPASPSTPSVTAILFDSMNTDFLDSGFARARVEKFISGVEPTDRVALYGLSTSLTVLHDFTGDSAALIAALDRFKFGENVQTSATKFKESNVGGPFDALNNDMDQRVSDFYMGVRVQNTASALEAVAKHLAGLAGRKNLIWVSGSFPLSIGYFQKRLPGAHPSKGAFDSPAEEAARALSSADVAIYPVNAHALTTLQGVFNAATAPKPSSGQLTMSRRPPERPPDLDLGAMQKLAGATGGLVFANTNDIGGAVRRAIDDGTSTYLLGYYPDHNQWDGRFREIKVQVKQPGLEVRARRGYIAYPDAPPDQNRPALTAASSTPEALESTELGLAMEVDSGATARLLKGHLRIDVSGMRFEQKDGRWLGDLDYLWVQFDAEGKPVLSNSQTLTFKLSPQTYQSAVANGLKMSFSEAIESATTKMRFLARDRANGATGSVTIPVADLYTRR